jgi:8-oxo-dGTP pyrophosphatase MutT (NUDIX family)
MLITPSLRALELGNAAAAILVLKDGRYLLQLRDDIPGIWYPGHWGLFGGGVEAGEDELTALRRELREEIGLDLEDDQARLFTRFEFDLRPAGKQRYFRSYYEVRVPTAILPCLTLHEGADMQAFSPEKALALRLSPYDGFALLLYSQHAQHGESER